MISKYSQYKNDFFNKLDFSFKPNKQLLDVGCGDGLDAKILEREFKLKVFGTDIYKDEELKKNKIPFKLGSIYKIPYKKGQFDYAFVHDVIHHIDESHHRKSKHLAALKELKRVVKKGGALIIVEGNRFNPLFYPHMVKMRGHDHLRQGYFKKIIEEAYNKDQIAFHFFEAHSYPKSSLLFWKIYEKIMEKVIPKRFIAYNAAFITINEK